MFNLKAFVSDLDQNSLQKDFFCVTPYALINLNSQTEYYIQSFNFYKGIS